MIAFSLLLFGGLYLAFCLWLSWQASKRKSPGARFVYFPAALIILLCLPVADGLWGKANLKRLCATELTSAIYGSVLVPANLLDDNRMPRARNRFGAIDWTSLKPYLELRVEESDKTVWPVTLHHIVWTLVRASDGTEVARNTQFYFRGGWLKTNGDGIGAGSCTAIPSVESILPKVIVPKA
jgi:hypothetical protein